jgi:hypothetical protein
MDSKMAYTTVNGKLVKTSKVFANRSIIFQGETDWCGLDWSPKLRDHARKMFDAFVKHQGCSDKEAVSILVSTIGDIMASDRQDDLRKDLVLLSSMAMYASVCVTPNEFNDLNKGHNYASVVILPSKNGFAARWVGTFKAKDDLSALSHTWGGLLTVARPMFNTDKDFAGYSDSYDKAVKMLATA